MHDYGREWSIATKSLLYSSLPEPANFHIYHPKPATPDTVAKPLMMMATTKACLTAV